MALPLLGVGPSATFPTSRARLADAPGAYEPYGSVTLDGFPAPDGTLVTGVVPGATVSGTTNAGFYLLSIPGDDPNTPQDEGGDASETVTFAVEGCLLPTTTPWYPDRSERVDLTAATSSWYRDADGDGYGDPSVTSQAICSPDGYVANNTDCDDEDPDEFPDQAWYLDADQDGYGDGTTMEQCERPADCHTAEELTATSGDCDDSNSAVHPAATELCNTMDDDCDGLIDDADPDVTGQSTWYADTDGDGYGDPDAAVLACSQPTNHVADATDCDDGDSAIHPGADERCNGFDDDCDGHVDEGFPDSDGDGTPDCLDEDDDGDGVLDGADCASLDADAWQLLTGCLDQDGDGYGAGSIHELCTGESLPAGYVQNADDCDDTDADVHPGAPEVCNSIDDDCDDLVDDADDDCSGQPTWYADTDGDGYGDQDAAVLACSQPTNHVPDATDCDDHDPNVHPSAEEVCNRVDDDCDHQIDCEDPDCAAPRADAGGPYAGNRTETLSLNASGSFDPDGSIVNYRWKIDSTWNRSGLSSIHHLPLAGQTLGVHTLTLLVTDDDACTDQVTTTLVVSNALPVAASDALTASEDTPAALCVTLNDHDPDGDLDLSTLAVISGPLHGTTVVTSKGVVTYAPSADYFGSDAFSYVVQDLDGGTSNRAEVEVTVTAVNDPPVAVNDTVQTERDVPVAFDVLANDYDVDGSIDANTVALLWEPDHGNAYLASGGVITYTPVLSYVGTDALAYVVQDHAGSSSNEAVVTIRISAPDLPARRLYLPVITRVGHAEP